MRHSHIWRLLTRWAAILPLGGAALGQQAPALETRVLYAQDFEQAQLGTPPYPVSDNSGWAGSTLPMAVADSGDPRHGRVLECRVSGYCQIVLGQTAIQAGHLYRVGLDIGSRGAQTVTVILRHGPSPEGVRVPKTG